MTGASLDEPLRIALLNLCYWPEVQRGGERIMHDVATGLAERGHRPQIITSHPGLPSRTVEEGVEVVRNWRPPDLPLRLRKIGDDLTHVPFSLRSLLKGDPDVAHAFYASDALAAVAWARRSGRPSVLSWMGLMMAGWQSSRALRLETITRAVYGSDAVVVLSRTARDSLWRWMGVEPRVIYPGVETRRFSPGGVRHEEPTVVCAAAADVPAKRVGLLVRAFAHVRRELPSARLILIRPHDPALARELADNDGIELSDGGTDEVVHLYRSAWVSALPSVNESFGLVIAEALACGTPGVAATGFGPQEILSSPDVGRLFGGDDERALARALLEALELSQDPGCAAACVRRAADFSPETATAAHEKLYRELLGRS